MTYYNDNDKFVCKWLKNLIKEGHISNGYVDERSIFDINAKEIQGYSKVHFFAGIGGWDYALKLAGWPENRQVWTGSCPCQPFSQAGKGQGKKDERHIAPIWLELIKKCRPTTIFGEQVSAAIGSENKNLSGMLERIGTLEVLLSEAERQDILSARLQILRDKEKNIIPSGEYRAKPFDADEMEREIKRINSLLECKTQSERHESAIHTGSAVGTGKNRQEFMRINRDPFQLDWRKDMGQSFNRQDCTRKGVYKTQLPLSDLFSKCNDAQLGGEQNSGNCRLYYGDQTEKLRRLAGEARKELKEAIAHGWLDELQDALEKEGYAVGSAILPACSVGAPHKRNRLWFVAHLSSKGLHIDAGSSIQGKSARSSIDMQSSGMANSNSNGLQSWSKASKTSRHRHTIKSDGGDGFGSSDESSWRNPEYLLCRDGNWRPVEPELFPLAYGTAFKLGSGSPFEGKSRTGMLKGYGNCIIPQLAAQFISAFMETTNETSL